MRIYLLLEHFAPEIGGGGWGSFVPRNWNAACLKERYFRVVLFSRVNFLLTFRVDFFSRIGSLRIFRKDLFSRVLRLRNFNLRTLNTCKKTLKMEKSKCVKKL